MIGEPRRRGYLTAMQVTSWLPVQVLPFAAPSRLPVEPESTPQSTATVAPQKPANAALVEDQTQPLQSVQRQAVMTEPEANAPVAPSSKAAAVVPRFSLQLYRAGACLLLVELPTGEAFQSRDPAYLLLRDMLRAAGLPDSPQLLGDPVRWPLLARSNLDQGPSAARDFLHVYLADRMQDQSGCACLWLVGLPALRHAGEVEADRYNHELQIDGLGSAWAIPGLELLMDEPQRKAPLWQAMRQLMPRWKSANA